MRLAFLILALTFTNDAETEGQDVHYADGFPEFIGAPCSLQSDYDASGKCVLVEVRRKPRIRK